MARLHGGVLQLLDNHPGLRAQMVLPVAERAAPRPERARGTPYCYGYCFCVASMKASMSRFILAIEGGFTYIMCPAS